MGFIASSPHLKEYGETATLLLAMCEEKGIPTNLVRTVMGGFEVPDEISEALKPEPPAWWHEPQPEVNVTLGEDGKYYAPAPSQNRTENGTVLTEPDREVVRAWAKAQGIQVADSGQLKKVVYEAYRAAQAE